MKILHIVSILLFSIFCLVTDIFGQTNGTGKIIGNITGLNSRILPNIPVILHTNKGKFMQLLLSDSTGKFMIDSLNYGTYYLNINAIGFKIYKSDSIVVASPYQHVAAIQLLDSVADLSEVKITTKKHLFEMLPDKMVMNIENSILETGNTVFDIIRKAPMVSLDKEQNLLLKALTPMIYIDDRPTYISGSQLTEYLKSLPSESVASIEFITNPSSKYDAAGSAGIINIRLKKNKLYGWNGIVNARFGYGKYPKTGGGLNINYRNGWLNAYINWNSSYGESYNALTYDSRIVNNGVTSFQDRENYWHPKSTYHDFKGGVDLNLGKTDVIRLMVSGNMDNTHQITTNNSVLSDADRQPYEYIETVLDGKDNVYHLTYNANFKHELDSLGSFYTADADYTEYNQKSYDNNENNFLDADGNNYRTPYIFRNNRPSKIKIKSGKIDYTKYWKSKLKLESGLKYSSVDIDDNLVMDSIKDNQWETDFGRSNHFVYKEDIAAFYSNVSHTFGNVSLQVGFRGELTQSNAHSITSGTIVKRNYFNLFPTFFTTYRLDSNNDLNFSYSRRINRPSYESLNPFVRYIDPYTSFIGNPFLKPSFSNSFEIKHGFKKFLYTSISYSHSSDVITTTILQDSTTGKVINSSGNANSQDYIYLSVYASVPLKEWWSSENNVSVSYNRSRSSIPDYTYTTKGFGTDMSSNHTFSLPHSFKIQTSFRYSFPSIDGLARMKNGYGWDLGIQKQILDKKGTFKIAATNIISQSAYRAHYIGSGLDINWINRWEARRVTVSFVYKFGNQKIKATNARSTSSSEEQNRVGL